MASRARLLLVTALAAACAARAPADAGGLLYPAEVLVRRPPRSTGSLDGDRAGWAVFERRGALARCYRAAGGPRSAGRGILYVILDVLPSGEVGRVSLGHSAVRGPGFEACLSRALGSLRVPPSDDGSAVQVLLVLGAEDEAEARALLASYRARRRAGRAGTAGPVELPALRRLLQPCFDSALRRRPGLGGRGELRLSLGAEGRVTEASFSMVGHRDPALRRCVEGTVRGLHVVPDDPDARTFTFPVIVSPGR